MREPLALVLRNLSGTVHRICVDRQIAILVDSANYAVASLHQMFQIGVFREIELLSGSHIGKLWHELLKECESSGSFRCLSAWSKDKTSCLRVTQGLVESLAVISLIECDNCNSGFDGAHLCHNRLSCVSLIAVEHEFVSRGEASLNKTEGKGRTVSL